MQFFFLHLSSILLNPPFPTLDPKNGCQSHQNMLDYNK